jgi:acetolactate synthase-1/2/3 large subunit
MNGAESLINSLADAGVELCFANPGTSEMQLVAAIDQQPRMRAVLCLYEGVVSGAADGYGRMADKPALTLLHLGPGFANASSNLHNARRAHSPVLNMIGDHATYHLQYDAPLTADIEGFASPVSAWIGVSSSADDLAATGLEGWARSQEYPGKVCSFIAPANHAWEESQAIPSIPTLAESPKASDELVAQATEALSNAGGKAIMLGGRALREDALVQAGRIAEATGARIITETFYARHERGEGRVAVERLPYFGEQAQDFIKELENIVFIGTKPPVSFFAYPEKPSWLSPEGANLVQLADVNTDALDALTRLADELGCPAEPTQFQERNTFELEQGPANALELGKIMANRMPEGTIVSDEGATNGLFVYAMTPGAAKHDWLTLTGGSIGQGLPLSIGAALACPDRKVIALQADGSAMYTVQALWTMARENLDITVLLLNNSSYAILNIELQRVGVDNPGPTALSLLDLSNPTIQWTEIATGMGIKAQKVTQVQELDDAFAAAMAERGPRLIEVIL